MTTPEEPVAPEPPLPPLPPEPTRELLLAQALDACIQAERRVPGSADEIIGRQPVWARADLRALVNLAGSLDAVATNAIMSDAFRVSARKRLMESIGGEATPTETVLPATLRLRSIKPNRGSGDRHLPWLWRWLAGVLVLAVAIGAALNASGSSLPDEPLYRLKQACEEFTLRFAADDQARSVALLARADARLDETARLLQLGRTDAALDTTRRYDQNVERATSTYAVSVSARPPSAPAVARLDGNLTRQQQELQVMLKTAPERVQAGLREALVAAERGRALLANPQPLEHALGRDLGSRSTSASSEQTVSADDLAPVAPAPAVPPILEPAAPAA